MFLLPVLLLATTVDAAMEIVCKQRDGDTGYLRDRHVDPAGGIG